MAKAIILNFALVLLLILIISVAESRAIISVKSKESITVVCDTVTAVSSGSTCFDIAKINNLTIAQFDTINPNLNCNALFVGQWLCIFGFITV